MASNTASGAAVKPLLPFYRITTVKEPPYVMSENAMDGTPKYVGFLVDLLDELRKNVGFDYSMHLAPDQKYGTMLRNGSFNGMIGEIQRGEAEIAAGPTTVTVMREKVVDFSKPYLTTGVQLLVQKPTWQSKGLGILVEPFTTELWFLVLIFFIVVSILLFIIGRFSPYEWGRLGSDNDKRGARFSFTLRNSFLFTFSTICWQGYREAPKSMSGRILAAFWWIFCLFGIVAYTANLTAVMLGRSQSVPSMPFQNYLDLSQSDIPVGVVEGGSTLAQIRDSNVDKFHNLYKHVTEMKSYVKNYEQGINKVLDGKGVMLMEGVTATYVAKQNCDLMVFGESIFPHSLAFACTKNSNICSGLSKGILTLREDGTVQQLYNKWWIGKCKETEWQKYAQKVETPIVAFEVSSRDLAVSFLLLFVGIVLSILLLIAEIVIFKVWGTKEKPIPDVPKPIFKVPRRKPKPSEPASVKKVDETKIEEETADKTAEQPAADEATTTPTSEPEAEASAPPPEQAPTEEAKADDDKAATEVKAEA